MSNFVEVQIYNGGQKVTLNLDMAQSIAPTAYKDAQAIVTYPDSASEAITYYVTDSYKFLSELARKVSA